MTNGHRAIKVALVGPYPLEEGKICGGIEGVSAALARGLRALQGVEVHVITASSNAALVAGGNGPSITVVPQSRRLRRITFYWLERRRVLQCIRGTHPDVVHVQGQNWYAIAALAAGYPTVVTLHGMLHKEAGIIDRRSALLERLFKRTRGVFNTRFEAETLRLARHIVVISPYVKECIEKMTHARLHPVPNPIDDAFFEVDPEEIPDRLLFVGALEPRKGLHYAIEAVAALCQRRPQTSLHVVGSTLDEGYARALRIYVRSHGVEGNVRFLGFIDQNQLLDEYRHCCLLVLPSREETSPLSVQQAMAAGKAVVATRAGGIPHLVEDGVTGCLVEWSDVRQLANTLDSLLGDEELRRRLGVLGKRRADEQFRIEPIARRTLEIYQEVLKDASYQDAARPASAGIQGR